LFPRSSSPINLPSMPATIACIVSLTKSADLNADALAEAVLMDQSITAKILRLANSAYFGRRAKAKTVTESVLILGFSLVRNIAASASVLEAVFPRQAFPGLSWPAFWTHSVAAAVSTEVLHAHISGISRKEDESAFIAGLLHDLGKMIIAYATPVQFAEIVAHCIDYGTDIYEAEEIYIGTNHALVGKELAKLWDFPEKLIEAIGSHHSLKANVRHPELVKAVRIGNLLAKSVRGEYIACRQTRFSVKSVLDEAGIDARYADMILTDTRDGLERCRDIVAWGKDLPYCVGKAA
jgi:HD-like signal output (HDOD) protein